MEKDSRELKLARGLLIKNGAVLLAQDVRSGKGHYFLPGGNVDPGESVKATLPREWNEELGWKINVTKFIGCLEHAWDYRSKEDGAVVTVVEVNYLFQVEASAEDLNAEPQSKESHLRFAWIPVNQLSSIDLRPQPLKSIIPDILESTPGGIWASTL